MQDKCYKSNSGNLVGRPQKGMRDEELQEIAEMEPLPLHLFIREVLEHEESNGATVSLMYFDGKRLLNYETVGGWNIAKVVCKGGEVKYKSINSFEEDYQRKVEKFRAWQKSVLGGVELSAFEENGGLGDKSPSQLCEAA